MRLPGLAVCMLLVACIGPRGPAAPEQWAPIEARVAYSEHAPTIDVPWWWRDTTPPDGATCQRIGEGGVGVLGGEQVMPALLVIDGERLRLADTTVLALTDGAVPPEARDEASIVPLAAAMATIVKRHRAYLAACGRAGDPIDVLIAGAPDTPQHVILAVMFTMLDADIERIFFAVGGGRPGKRWTPDFTIKEEQLELELDGDRWKGGVDWDRREDVPISDLARVPELLQGRPLGCATVPLRLTEPWVRAVGELDVLAGLGAHQFYVTSGSGYGFPVARTTGTPGARISVRVGGTVAALMHRSPQIHTLDPRHELHTRQFSPCVGMFAAKGIPPEPGELEAARRAYERGEFERPDGDVWGDLWLGPRNPGPKPEQKRPGPKKAGARKAGPTQAGPKN